jgi:hypothetical protein
MRRLCNILFAVGVCALGYVGGCGRPSSPPEKTAPSGLQTELNIPANDEEPPPVVFGIKRNDTFAGVPGVEYYECRYQAHERIAQFGLEFKKGPMTGKPAMSGVEGKFVAIAGSEDSALLQDLAKALEAKRIPRNSIRIPELPFDGIVLGEAESRNFHGGYSENPKGDWTTMKIFLPKGGDDGEVYLNVNPVSGQGEFSIKDSDYGDYVIAEFAKVL